MNLEAYEAIKSIAKQLANPNVEVNFSKDSDKRNELEAKIKDAFRKEVGDNKIATAIQKNKDLSKLFTIVTEEIDAYIEPSMSNLMDFVEPIPLAWGEDLVLEVTNPDLFKVIHTAAGNADVIEQHVPLNGKVPVETSAAVVKIVQGVGEYLKTDGQTFAEMIGRVAESFLQDRKNRVGEVFLTAGDTQAIDTKEFSASSSGTFADSELNEATQYVMNKNQTNEVLVLGTWTALNTISGNNTAILPESAKEELYTNGFTRVRNGVRLVAVDQFYDGATEVLSNKEVRVIPAAEQQFVKYVYRPMLMGSKDFMDSADWKQRYFAYTEDEIMLASSDYQATYDWS